MHPTKRLCVESAAEAKITSISSLDQFADSILYMMSSFLTIGEHCAVLDRISKRFSVLSRSKLSWDPPSSLSSRKETFGPVPLNERLHTVFHWNSCRLIVNNSSHASNLSQYLTSALAREAVRELDIEAVTEFGEHEPDISTLCDLPNLLRLRARCVNPLGLPPYFPKLTALELHFSSLSPGDETLRCWLPSLCSPQHLTELKLAGPLQGFQTLAKTFPSLVICDIDSVIVGARDVRALAPVATYIQHVVVCGEDASDTLVALSECKRLKKPCELGFFPDNVCMTSEYVWHIPHDLFVEDIWVHEQLNTAPNPNFWSFMSKLIPICPSFRRSGCIQLRLISYVNSDNFVTLMTYASRVFAECAGEFTMRLVFDFNDRHRFNIKNLGRLFDSERTQSRVRIQYETLQTGFVSSPVSLHDFLKQSYSEIC